MAPVLRTCASRDSFGCWGIQHPYRRVRIPLLRDSTTDAALFGPGSGIFPATRNISVPWDVASSGVGVVLDTGPLVAFLDASDRHHPWAVAEFERFRGAVLFCEPVVTEALYLLRGHRPAQEKILEWIERGDLTCDFTLFSEAGFVRGLWRRYGNVPMSLADACLVRLAELHPLAEVCSIDSDFVIYRKSTGERLRLSHPSIGS